MRYLPFYRYYGFRKLSHFMAPPILREETFNFPDFSSLHYFIPTSIPENISPNTQFLGNVKDAVVKNIFEYTTEDLDGNFRKLNVKAFEIIKNMKKACKKWKFLLTPDQKAVLKRSTLFIHNYTTMNKRYIYTAYPLARYDQFCNSFKSLVTSVNKDTTENKFVFLEIPDEVYSYQLLNKLDSENGTPFIKKITDYRYFNILEIWKYLNGGNNNSLLNDLTDKENVTLVLLNNKKAIVLALGVLTKFITSDNITREETDLYEHSLEELVKTFNLVFTTPRTEADFSMYKIKPLNPKLLKKLFLITWSKHLETDPDQIQSVDEQLVTTPNVIEPEQEEVVDISKIDLHIEKQVDTLTEETTTEHVTEEEFQSQVYDEGVDEDDEISIRRRTKDEFQLEAIDKLLEDLDKNVEDLNKEEIEKLKESGTIQKVKANNLNKAIEERAKIKTPYQELGDKTIAEIVKTKDDIKLDKNRGAKTDNEVVFDKSMNNDLVSVFNSDYIKNHMKKDTLKVVSTIEKSGFIISDYKIEPDRSILGKTDKHTITYKSITGKPITVNFILPVFEENGTYTENKNQYKLRLQRTEIPILKLSNTQVLLNSYYSKIFVSKADKKVDDYSFKLSKEMMLSDSITKPVLEEIVVYDTELPKLYELIMRHIKSFTFKRNILFTFDYKERFNTLVEDEKLRTRVEQLEKQANGILVGKDNNSYYFMCFDNTMKKTDGNNFALIDYTDLYTELGVTKERLYSEFVSIKVMGTIIPIYLLFAYYIGLENALQLFSLSYKFISRTDKDYKKPERTEENIVVKFADGYLVIDRDFGVGDSVFVAMTKHHKELIRLPYSVFSSKDNLTTLLTLLSIPNPIKNEIKFLDRFFIDPMTKELLESMNEPTTFVPLLKRACEMLVDDKRVNPDNIELSVIKGVERVNGMLYAELTKAIKTYESRSEVGRVSFAFDPYCVLKKLKDDNTQVLVNDTNAISALSQHREITLLGVGGRNEISVTNEDRKYNETYYGTITEHFKDNGASGIVGSLTANPQIENVRGKISNADRKIEGSGSVMSIAAQCRSFADRDDGKRLNFINLQSQHVIPINNKRPNYIRTGYEAVMPLSLDKKFIIIAEEDGEALKVTPKHVEVKYNSGRKETYPIKHWTSKEESEACYRHIMAPNVKPGDKFSKDDTLIYDTAFFQPDIFNPKRVIYTEGVYLDVAVCDQPDTHEDSSVISAKVRDKLSTTNTKVKSIVLEMDKDVPFIVNIGDEVKSDDAIMTYIDRQVGDKDLPKETLEILKDLKKNSPKAKVKGKISNIEVYYNGDLKEYSKNVRKIIEASDQRLLELTGFTGKVDYRYSIKGKPMLENSFEIKIYIDVNEQMGVGDKCVFGNQLKSVVGNVFHNDVRADDGTEIEAFFGYTSIQARVVFSPYLIGTTAKLLDWVAQDAIKAYFGK